MHITASVFINDDESGLHHDYEVWLEKLAPFDAYSKTYPPQPHGAKTSPTPVCSGRWQIAKRMLFASIRRRQLAALAS